MLRRNLLIIFFVIIICFIFINSILSSDISTKISEVITLLLGGDLSAKSNDHFAVRKLAHFIEFCALGVVAVLLLRNIPMRDNLFGKIMLLLVGITIPLVDETIQIFSNRGSSLKDVWIDMSGYLVGCLLCVGIIKLVAKLKNKNKGR